MKKEMTLTEKIFTLEYLCGMICYVLGVLLITPDAKGKMIIGGAMVLVLILLLIQLGRKQSEQMDERGQANLDHASTITLRVLLLLVAIFAVLLYFMPLKWALPPVLVFAMGLGLWVHAYNFKRLEEAGA